MAWVDIEQNSDAWFELRIGRITCSEFPTLYMKESTKGFKKFIREKAFERLMGERIEDKFNGNWILQQGTDREQIGADQYELETFRKVTPGGFWIYSDTVGGSPDRHTEGGLVEIKSKLTETFLEKLDNRTPEKIEAIQTQGQMLVSGYDWVDLVYTSPHENLRPIIQRIERDEDAIKDLIEKLDYANKLIDKEQETLKKYLK